jgi:hypothetical protein
VPRLRSASFISSRVEARATWLAYSGETVNTKPRWPRVPKRQCKVVQYQSGANFRFCSLAVLRCHMLSDRARSSGEVPERSNGAVSKTVVPLTGTEGSNPSLSAITENTQ